MIQLSYLTGVHHSSKAKTVWDRMVSKQRTGQLASLNLCITVRHKTCKHLRCAEKGSEQKTSTWNLESELKKKELL